MMICMTAQRSLLAAALLSVFGTAAAADSQDITHEDYTLTSGERLDINEGQTFSVVNTFTVEQGATLVNNGLVTAGKLVINGSIGEGTRKGTISAGTIEFHAAGYGAQAYNTLETAQLLIDDRNSQSQAGLMFGSDADVSKIENVVVESTKGLKTGLEIAESTAEHPVDLTFGRVELRADDDDDDAATKPDSARIEVFKDSIVRVGKLVGSANASRGAKTMVQTNYGASAYLPDITVEAGRMNLQTNAHGQPAGGPSAAEDPEATGRFYLRTVTVASGGNLRASVYNAEPGVSIHDIDNQGLVFNMAAGSQVDFGGYDEETNTDWRPEDIALTARSLTVNVGDLGENGALPRVLLSAHEGNVELADGIRVVSAAANNTGSAAEDLARLADVVKFNAKNETGNVQSEVTGVDQVVEQLASDIYDGSSAEVVDGELTNVATQTSDNIKGITGVATLGVHLWRNEMNDVGKRLGDLRLNPKLDNGLWARVWNGRADLGSRDVENKYTGLQMGLDRQIFEGVWLGGAFSYTDGENDIVGGSGDSYVAAFTGYATKVWDNGAFLDVTAKFGRIDSEFELPISGERSAGDYDTNAWSFSIEAGHRFGFADGLLFVEPQLEYMYGRVSDVTYGTSTGLSVEQDEATLSVGRAGVMLGITCPNNRGNAYLRASVLHDWDGEVGYDFSKSSGEYRSWKDDLGGTWYEFGLGANLVLTDAVRFYADIESAQGGEVDTDYRVNLGVRWGF